MKNHTQLPFSRWRRCRYHLTSAWSYTLLSSLIVIAIGMLSKQPADPSDARTAAGQSSWCKVLKIVDGDSVNVSCYGKKHRLRLMHIDAPEMRQGRWGQSAKQALAELAGRRLWVEFHGRDVYHRDLAVIYADKSQPALNLRLVELGAARVYRRYRPPAAYVVAMKSAKKAGIGIWRQAGLQQDPQRFRRLAN